MKKRNKRTIRKPVRLRKQTDTPLVSLPTALTAGLVLAFLVFVITSAIQKKPVKKIEPKQRELTSYDEQVFERPTEFPTPPPEQISHMQKIPIIMYHYVEYVADKNDVGRQRLNVVPSLFEGHLKELKKANYETYFVKDVPDILNGTIDYASKSAILSFDDGYSDFYTDVFPLLKKYHVRATVYVIYNYIGRKGFLTHAQIQDLIDSDLVEIGSHTLNHAYLKTMGIALSRKEIFESKKNLEHDFGISIKTFAYPFGAMSPETVQLVKDAGYTASVSVISGTMQTDENIFYLSRIRPGLFTPSTMIQVIEKMTK